MTAPVQDSANYTATSTSAATVGDTFPIPTNSHVVVDVQASFIASGAGGSKLFNERIEFLNDGGTIEDGEQASLVGPTPLKSEPAAVLTITRTGTTGRVECSGAVGKWKVHKQVDTNADFNLADLNWTLFVQGDYSGSPWEGETSAGSSGSNDLTEATNPPSVGTAQNGHDPADFDGTNDRLNTGLAWDDLIDDDEFFIDFVGLADAVPTAASYDAQLNVIGDNNGYCGVAWTSNGLTVAVADTTLKSVTKTAGTGSYQRFQARLSGGQLEARINGGTWTGVSCGTVDDVTTGNVKIGANYNLSEFFNGRILHLAVSATAFDNTTADNIDAAHVARYGL